MLSAKARPLLAGTRVRVRAPITVPPDCTWDDDFQRTSTSVKRRLQELFFQGDRTLHAEIVYVVSETERVRLQRKNQLKVEVRSPAGSSIIINAPVEHLHPCT